jgi:hypothetical protein
VITGASSGFSALTVRTLCVRPFSEDLPGFALAVAAPSEIFRKMSQNFSPAGVTSLFLARAMPMDTDSVVPMRGFAPMSSSHERAYNNTFACGTDLRNAAIP